MSSEKVFWVYITASAKNGTLYIGVTSDLLKRIWQHKNKVFEGFSVDHGVDKLMWFEQHSNAEAAITREKAAQEMESVMENRTDRENQPRLARPVRRAHTVK